MAQRASGWNKLITLLCKFCDLDSAILSAPVSHSIHPSPTHHPHPNRCTPDKLHSFRHGFRHWHPSHFDHWGSLYLTAHLWNHSPSLGSLPSLDFQLSVFYHLFPRASLNLWRGQSVHHPVMYNFLLIYLCSNLTVREKAMPSTPLNSQGQVWLSSGNYSYFRE